MSDMKAPLKKVHGLGSAQNGTHHWWLQRVTAIANIPLTLWFAMSVTNLLGTSHDVITAWIGQPLVAVMLTLMVLNVCYHLRLGLQVAIEDYVHGSARVASMLALTFGTILLAAIGVFSILKVSLGG